MYQGPCLVSRTEVREPLELVIQTEIVLGSTTAGALTVTVGAGAITIRLSTGGCTTLTAGGRTTTGGWATLTTGGQMVTVLLCGGPRRVNRWCRGWATVTCLWTGGRHIGAETRPPIHAPMLP